MQANIKATNNNNWFPATSKSFCTWKMERANSGERMMHFSVACPFQCFCMARHHYNSGEEMTSQKYDVIITALK
jgi:hypothetical protein